MMKQFVFCVLGIIPLMLYAQIDYNSQIQSIFNANCINCHGSSGGLSLTSYDNLMTGGNHGEVVTPFDADNSILVQKLQPNPPFGDRMPRNNQSYFDDHPDELQLIIDWINEGASEFISVTANVEIPGSFAILESYPNPFNAAVTITFSVHQMMDLELEVVDILGRRVTILARGVTDPGRHRVIWLAEDISSGLYFARLNADGWSSTAKLLLLK